MPAAGAVGTFRPSTNGFHFPNRFPPGPTVRVAGVIDPRWVGIGDAESGLCGGMSWLARERFEAGLSIPPTTSPPENASPLFGQLVDRQVRSLRWLSVPWRFYVMSASGLTRARRDSLVKEFPRVREEIDQGRVALVGLVRKASWNPFALTDNHQVLAYAYEVDEAGAITLRIYDPNHPDDDGVTIGLGRVAGQSTGEPLIGFLALD